jgi:hypothetical protein
LVTVQEPPHLPIRFRLGQLVPQDFLQGLSSFIVLRRNLEGDGLQTQAQVLLKGKQR